MEYEKALKEHLRTTISLGLNNLGGLGKVAIRDAGPTESTTAITSTSFSVGGGGPFPWYFLIRLTSCLSHDSARA